MQTRLVEKIGALYNVITIEYPALDSALDESQYPKDLARFIG